MCVCVSGEWAISFTPVIWLSAWLRWRPFASCLFHNSKNHWGMGVCEACVCVFVNERSCREGCLHNFMNQSLIDCEQLPLIAHITTSGAAATSALKIHRVHWKREMMKTGKSSMAAYFCAFTLLYFVTRNEAHNAMFKISSVIVCIALTLHWQPFALWKLNFVGLMIIVLFFSCICKDNIYQHCCGKCHKPIYDIACCKHTEPALGFKC